MVGSQGGKCQIDMMLYVRMIIDPRNLPRFLFTRHPCT